MDHPLSVSVAQDDCIELKISGGLSHDRLPALSADIKKAESVIKEVYSRTGKRVKVLIDITDFDGTYDVDAIKAMTEFAQDDAHVVERTASFGGPDTAKISGEIVVGLARRDNIKVFASKGEALAWLSSGSN